MPLYLCLRFARLPLQCLTSRTTPPKAVVEKHRIVACNDSAAACGITPGQSANTARALSAELELLPRNPAREALCMERLCQWAYTITPLLQPQPEHTLLLDIGGSLRLFGGTHGLLQQLQRTLGWRKLDYQLAVAPSPKAAWLLSRLPHDTPAIVDSLDTLKVSLSPLPLQWLPSCNRAVTALDKAGIQHLGELFKMSLAAIRERCGEEFNRYLAQLLGIRSDPIPQYQVPQRFAESYDLGYGVITLDELQPTLHTLLERLIEFLHSTQTMTSTLHWKLGNERQCLHSVTVSSSRAQGRSTQWLELTQLKLRDLSLQQPIFSIELQAEQLDPINRQLSSDLFASTEPRQPLHYLLDRLRSRLGDQALHHVGERDEHLPETALMPVRDHRASENNALAEARRRPFWLLPVAQPLTTKAGVPQWQGALQLLAGPERIEDGWWQQPISRDYYVAQSPAAGPCWIYRDRRTDTWYLHGLFT
jgi:protein ImuB